MTVIGLALPLATAAPGDEVTVYWVTADPPDIAGRVVCEMRDNPLFVVPDSERPALLAQALARRPDRKQESFQSFLTGNLCPKCKDI